MRNHHNILGFVLLTVAAVMGVVGSGSGAQAQVSGAPATQRTGSEAVGAAVVHQARWTVEREPYTFDRTYGYTLWRPDTGEAHDHGGQPALRVALAYELEPEGIDAKVREVAADLPVRRQTVDVARKHEGIAVGPIPGSTPSTEVYVPVNGRVYLINVYAAEPGQEGLGEEDRELLKALRFDSPSRSVSSLDVPAANAPEELYASGNPELLEREQEAREDAPAGSPEVGARSISSRGGASYQERRIYEGCWLANSDFFFQTQHGKYANKGRYPGRRAGWTRIGKPNYWGQYTHGNLNYGRCNEPDWTNDKFAVDYPLRRGDVVFSPFKRGTVTFAGRNTSHKNYGIFVTIRAANGKYVSMSAHLNGLAPGIKRGAKVTDKTIIGYAGDSGDRSIPVGRVHLHQAFYRYPKLLRDGSPYGGAGLQALFHHYVGTAAGTRPGTYKFGRTHTRTQLAEGDYISN